MEWVEKYGWDLDNHTYFKGIKRAGIGATKWEIVSLSDEESIVNLKKETKHRLYPAQLWYKRTLSDSTDPLQWDDEDRGGNSDGVLNGGACSWGRKLRPNSR
ncbi:hypothetical protein H9L39_17251 [Fusarium oxysporum f. sp. albedinis]|nr:hypothetical protein H9L39_17251 [Fusarium oxysporum f. sp. albedinis]